MIWLGWEDSLTAMEVGMALVLAMADIAPNQIKRATGRGAPGGAHTDFFKATREAPNGPSAYLVHNGPARKSTAHFHEVDQFQIILEGKGTFGRHEVAPYNIHFARAFTPYGPLMSDKETGWTFITLRTCYDPGAQRMSTEAQKLRQIADREPWQVHQKVILPVVPGEGVDLQEVPKIKDDRGLCAYALTLAPHTGTLAPDPSRGNGQFVLVTKGGLIYQGK